MAEARHQRPGAAPVVDASAVFQWVADHATVLALAVAVVSLLVGPALLPRAWGRRRSRPRLRIGRVSEDFRVKVIEFDVADPDETQPHVRLTAEEPRVQLDVENIGTEATSLRSAFTLTGYHPRERRRRSFIWLISSERDLPPHVERRITATLQKHGVYGAELPNWMRDAELLGFLWFKTYTLTPTRGRAVKVRIRSAGRPMESGSGESASGSACFGSGCSAVSTPRHRARHRRPESPARRTSRTPSKALEKRRQEPAGGARPSSLTFRVLPPTRGRRSSSCAAPTVIFSTAHPPGHL